MNASRCFIREGALGSPQKCETLMCLETRYTAFGRHSDKVHVVVQFNITDASNDSSPWKCYNFMKSKKVLVPCGSQLVATTHQDQSQSDQFSKSFWGACPQAILLRCALHTIGSMSLSMKFFPQRKNPAWNTTSTQSREFITALCACYFSFHSKNYPNTIFF